MADPQNLSHLQIPPMKDWQAFERFCRDLWAAKWKNDDTALNGRGGQAQAGVDVFGWIDSSDKMGGVQCKKKDFLADETLTQDELREIVEDAKAFSPPLAHLYVAYTGKTDAGLQQLGNELTVENRKNGLFDIHVYSWDEILKLAECHFEVFKKHFPQFFPPSTNTDAVEIIKSLDGLPSQIGAISEQIGDLQRQQFVVMSPPQDYSRDAALIQEYNSELDHAKTLLGEFKYKEALDFLESIESRILVHSDAMLKFRLITNKAVAKHGIGSEKEAGQLFIQAYQYSSVEEKALCNRALGHLLLDQKDDAISFAKQTLEKNPANTKALEIIIRCSPSSDTLDAIIERVPEALRITEGIASAFSNEAKKRGEHEKALSWLETAHSNAIGKSPDLQADLATMILLSFTSRHEVLSGVQISEGDTRELSRVIQLYTEAIETVKNTETIKYRVFWFVNRSSAYKLLGDLDRALIDIDLALEISPRDPGCLKQKAFLMHEKGDTANAIPILESIVDNPGVPEVAIILAQMYAVAGRKSEAKSTLEKSMKSTLPKEIEQDEKRMLIQLLLEEGDLDGARKISDSLRMENPQDVLSLVGAARIEQANNPTQATHLLDEAISYVSKDTSLRDLIELANSLYDSERYADAWPIYEKFTDVKTVSTFSNRLLYSYYRSGEVDKALAGCHDRALKGDDKFATQIHLSVLEDIGDLTGTISVAEKYLEKHQDDLEVRIRFATILFRLSQFEKLDQLLSLDVDISKLALQEGFQLVALLAERGQHAKALDLAYEIRRKYYSESDAHLKYFGAFFSREKQLDNILVPDVAKAGFAVRLNDPGSTPRWYLLEDRPDINVMMNELGVNEELAKKLLGKRVGDEIVMNDLAETKIKIAEIKSKYVYALHDTMEIFPQRFSHVPGLQRIPVNSTGTNEEIRESFNVMLKSIDARSEHVDNSQKLYLDAKITIGTFASLIGKSVVEVWGGLMGSKWGVRCCLGTAEERANALRALDTHDTLAVDITALMTAHDLGILDLPGKLGKKLLITQSTIDLLQGVISEGKGMQSEGFTTIGSEQGQYYRQEITEEAVKRQIEHLESLLKWVQKNCIVTPVKSVAKMDGEKREKLNEVIGKAFLETMLLAQENNCPMYSDDFGTRGFAKNEFNVDGFWTQCLVIQAKSKDLITQEEHDECVIRLVGLNYRHTTINGAVLLRAAKQSDWKNESHFAVVANNLGTPEMEIKSTAAVAAEFIALLWAQPILDSQREVLVRALLDALSKHKKSDELLGYIRLILNARLRFNPIVNNRIAQMLVAWRTLRIT